MPNFFATSSRRFRYRLRPNENEAICHLPKCERKLITIRINDVIIRHLIIIFIIYRDALTSSFFGFLYDVDIVCEVQLKCIYTHELTI